MTPIYDVLMAERYVAATPFDKMILAEIDYATIPRVWPPMPQYQPEGHNG